MKAVIFAGGVGTRLWPLSRKASPKQFAKIIGDKSTLELAVERMMPEFKPEDIYISTGKDYVERTRELLPSIPKENIIGEPAKRDNGSAVGLITSYLAKKFPNEPMVILWSDHLVKYEKAFKSAVIAAGKVVEGDNNKMIFIGQKARFASDNLGWIETGDVVDVKDGISFRKFVSFKYRPDEAVARDYFQNSNFCWNLGYFVTTPQFLNSLFQQYSQDIFTITEQITSKQTNEEFRSAMDELYPNLPEINFDKAILEKIPTDCAYVVIEDIGWSDIGAWEALKEALAPRKRDNVLKGKTSIKDSQDNLIYNYQQDKLVVAIDLQDLVVINTDDVLLVANKSSISKVKQVVESFYDTELENIT
jgi:mannose-1-phosphate guanylyltransferase